MYICLDAEDRFKKMSGQQKNSKKQNLKFIADEQADRTIVSRQAMKSEQTRADLLRAAEIIFARDGFEASRIEDIAAEAGRSRGAFYANFASKTEVFLALRALATRRRARELRERIEHVKDEAERYDAIIHYV